MAAEDHDWMLCMLFAVLGVVFGSFFSSVYPAFIAPSCKAVSAGCRKASSASSVSRTRGLRLCCNAENMEGQRQTLFDTCESQLGASKHPNNCTEERNQKKSTLDFCDDTSDSLQHQRNASQHPLYHITKMGQGGNHLDAYESHSHTPHHPSTESPISDDHDCNHIQTRELSILSPTPSKDSTMPNGNLKPDPFDPSKRHGYLSWDDYFMAIAFLSAHRSKDPNRQVGACLVSQDRVILGIGYNGFPRGCSDDKLPWAKMSVNGDPLQTKYPYVCHAEVNAILNKNHASACGQRLYVTMFPCNECAKIIIQAGVAEVIYFVGKTSSADCSYIASQKLLSMAGVKVWQHQPAQHKVVLDFK